MEHNVNMPTSGGGGDMNKSVYDADNAVAGAGGIKSWAQNELGLYLPLTAGASKPLTGDLYLKNGTSETGYYPSLGTSPSANLSLRSGNNVIAITRADGDTTKQIIFMPATNFGVAGKAFLGFSGSPWADGTFNDLHVGGYSLLPTTGTVTYNSPTVAWGNSTRLTRVGNLVVCNVSFQIPNGGATYQPFTVSMKPIAGATIVLQKTANAGDGASMVGTINESTGICSIVNSQNLSAGYYRGITVYPIS